MSSCERPRLTLRLRTARSGPALLRAEPRVTLRPLGVRWGRDGGDLLYVALELASGHRPDAGVLAELGSWPEPRHY